LVDLEQVETVNIVTFIQNKNIIDLYRLKGFAESGLVDYWIRKTLPKQNKCQLDNYKKAADEKRVISLKDLTGPFLFLLAGMAVSFLVFFIEKMVFKYRKSTGNNVASLNR